MKPKSCYKSFALCASIAFSMNAQAAPVTKAATGTDLASGASWGGTAPTAVDTATWTSASLGAGLTLGSAAAWDGISVTGALSDISITGAGSLTLGAGGIDMAGSAVSATLANPISLGDNQVWKVASGKTITCAGVISGFSDLTVGAAAPTATYNDYLSADSGSPTTVYPNTSLATITAAGGTMNGGWIGSTKIAGTYFFTNDGTTATYQLQFYDAPYTKAAKVQLTQTGPDVTAYQVYAKYKSGNHLGQDFDTLIPEGSPPAGSGGYGVNSSFATLGSPPAGTVTLAGANTFTGPVTVSVGVLQAGIASVPGVSGAFGSDAPLIMGNATGATADLNGFNTRIGSLDGGGAAGGNLSLGSATLTTGGDDFSTTFSGIISGTGGSLVKIGFGVQILSGNSTYTGGTTVNGGGLFGNTNESFGTGTITLGDTADDVELYLGNRADVANPVTVSGTGTGTVVIGADNTGGGSNAATFLGPITLNRATTFSGEVAADRLAFDGKLTGNVGTLTLTGGSRITFLSTESDFTGNLEVTGFGTIFQSSVGTAGEVIPNAASVDLEEGTIFKLAGSGGSTETIDALTGSGNTQRHEAVGGTQTLAVGSAGGSGEYSGTLSDGAGPLALTKLGAGTQTLSAINTYSGPTTINGGTLKLGGGGSINNTSALTVAPGALFDAIDGGGFFLAYGRTMIAGDNSPAADVTGPLTIDGTLRPAGNGSTGTISGVTDLILDDTLDFDRDASNTACDSIAINGTLTLGSFFDININTVGVPSWGTKSYTLVSGLATPLTIDDIANLPVLPANYAWNTTDPTALRIDYVQPGTNLFWVGNTNGVWDDTAPNWSGSTGSTYQTDDFVTFDDSATGTTTIEIPADVTPGMVLVNNPPAKPYTIDSAAGFGITGETQLAKTGTGTLTLLSNNIYSGGTSISEGVLAFGPDGLSTAGPIRMDGGTLRWHDANTQDISAALTLVAGKTAVLDTNGNDVTFLSGVGNATNATLAKVGAGNLTLAGAGTATGVTTIYGGTLTATNNAAFGSSVISLGDNTEPIALMLSNRADITNPISVSAAGTGTVTIGADNSGTGQNPAVYSGAVTLDRATTFSSSVPADRVAFDGKITGNVGLLTVTGGSRTTLASTLNDFTGDILVTGAGTVLQASVGTAPEVIPDATNLTIDAGATLQLASNGGGAETINALNGAGKVRTYTDQGGVFGSGLTVGAADGSGDFSGTLANGFSALSLAKTGTGTQTLSGASTYTGTTMVDGGTLAVTGSLGGNTTITVTTPGTLQLGDGSVTEDCWIGFKPTADNVSNMITGDGTATLNDAIHIDPSAADLTDGNSWLLVDVDTLAESYGANFEVTGFTETTPGVWTYAGAGSTWTFTEATGILGLTAAGYDGWAAANAPGQTIDMDHDGDGVPNGIEYFMGENGSGFTANPGLDEANTISWPKGVGYTGVYGADYVVQTSTDLATWDDVPAGQVTDGSPLEYTLPSDTSKKFTRLKVTGP